MARRTIVFTGFPGFIGARLIGRLLEDDPDATVVALVEPRMVDKARPAAAKVDAERIEVQPGDITDPKLGLGEAGYRALAERATSVHHLAAIYDLHVAASLAERVNVMGTQHIVDFCRAAPNLERHNYVSTAYTAGWRSGRVLESRARRGPGVQEPLRVHEVRRRGHRARLDGRGPDDDLPARDRRRGLEDRRDAEVRRPLLLAAAHPGVRADGARRSRRSAAAPRRSTSSRSTSSSRRSPRAHATTKAAGETFHLTDPEPVNSCELVNILAREYAGKETGYRIPPSMVERTLSSRRCAR